jgi:hypothetical protein
MNKNQSQATSAPEQHRQGDVLVEEVNAIPEGATLIGDPSAPRNERIVARGEQSNHAHIVTGNARVYRKGEAANAELYIEVLEKPEGLTEEEEKQMSAKLEHLLESTGLWTKEHAPIELTPGKTYRVVHQQEFDPYEKVRRAVMD